MGKRGAAVRKQWLCARGRGYRAPYGAEYGECHLFGSWQHLNNMLGPGPRGSPTPCPKVAPAVLYHAPGPRTPQPRESTIFRHGCPGQATKRAKFWMRPCGPASLRMGITQYSEVSAEYASLLVENYTNALRSVRKYDLEFFQPLAAPPNNHKSPKQPQRVQTRRSRDAEDHKDSNAPTTSSNEGDRAKLWTNARIVRGDAEAAETHQTRRWRISRDANDHGDSKTPTTK